MAVGSQGSAEAGDVGGGWNPGDHLRAEIERLGLDQIEVSRATGVSRQSINNIINGREPISRAMAGKLGRLTGKSSDYWLHAEFPRPGIAHRTSMAEGTSRPMGVGILVNHQIVRAVTDQIISIEPFMRSTSSRLRSISRLTTGSREPTARKSISRTIRASNSR